MSQKTTHASNSLFVLALGALGVVYGDIGTSPLYAVREIFFNHHYHIEHSHSNIFGVISTIFWALTVIVSFKYVVLVLRADNKGEGGVFALYSLLQKNQKWMSLLVSGLLVFAAGLLFGDGIITPAISVVSAIEGLTVVTPAFSPYVVPITLSILTGLFFVQRWGTAKIGSVFGPVISLWLISLSLLGLRQLVLHPEILMAINPWYAIQFLTSTPLHVLFSVLGSVMLVVTGGEAMYADMGHFGRLPIRISWFGLTYPALVLNYFGQGAFLLSEAPVVSGNLFFSMVPQVMLIPMVVLATMATIIASQALITGAFSLATQAISLKLLPYMKAVHTHEHHEGQIYVPMINWALYVGCVLLVIGFKSSANLASAYGLAVSGVMLVTTLGMILVSIHRWKWSVGLALGLFVPLAMIDMLFLTANSLKLFAGGYVPLMVAVVFYGVMKSWLWGRSKVLHAVLEQDLPKISEVVAQKKKVKGLA